MCLRFAFGFSDVEEIDDICMPKGRWSWLYLDTVSLVNFETPLQDTDVGQSTRSRDQICNNDDRVHTS